MKPASPICVPEKGRQSRLCNFSTEAILWKSPISSRAARTPTYVHVEDAHASPPAAPSLAAALTASRLVDSKRPRIEGCTVPRSATKYALKSSRLRPSLAPKHTNRRPQTKRPSASTRCCALRSCVCASFPSGRVSNSTWIQASSPSSACAKVRPSLRASSSSTRPPATTRARYRSAYPNEA